MASKLVQPPIGLAAVEAFYNPLNIVSAVMPGLPGSGKMQLHSKTFYNVWAFFNEVEQRGLSHLIKSYDGDYVNRTKRLSTQLSMHGRGAAFDINASTNNQGDPNGDMPPVLVQIAKSLGFFWGGDFAGKYVDKMHFQFGTDFALNGRPVPHVSAEMIAKYNSGTPTQETQTPPSTAHTVGRVGIPIVTVTGDKRDNTGIAGVILDGTGYIPVRAVSRLFGYSVDYDGNYFVLTKQ